MHFHYSVCVEGIILLLIIAFIFWKIPGLHKYPTVLYGQCICCCVHIGDTQWWFKRVDYTTHSLLITRLLLHVVAICAWFIHLSRNTVLMFMLSTNRIKFIIGDKRSSFLRSFITNRITLPLLVVKKLTQESITILKTLRDCVLDRT